MTQAMPRVFPAGRRRSGTGPSGAEAPHRARSIDALYISVNRDMCMLEIYYFHDIAHARRRAARRGPGRDVSPRDPDRIARAGGDRKRLGVSSEAGTAASLDASGAA